LPQIPIQIFLGVKKHCSSSNKILPPKLCFLPKKLIIQNCDNLKIQGSKFFPINPMHTRQSSPYFCMVKIKKFKYIYVQKNIKVVEFIENLYGQEVVGP